MFEWTCSKSLKLSRKVWSFMTSHSSSSLNVVLAVWLAAQTWRLHQARVNGQLATDPLFSAVTLTDWTTSVFFSACSSGSSIKLYATFLCEGHEYRHIGHQRPGSERQCSDRTKLSNLSRRTDCGGQTIIYTGKQPGVGKMFLIVFDSGQSNQINHFVCLIMYFFEITPP